MKKIIFVALICISCTNDKPSPSIMAQQKNYELAEIITKNTNLL